MDRYIGMDVHSASCTAGILSAKGIPGCDCGADSLVDDETLECVFSESLETRPRGQTVMPRFQPSVWAV